MTARPPSLHFHSLVENELCLIGAETEAALADEVRVILQTLEHTPDFALRDVAFTLAHYARGMPVVDLYTTFSGMRSDVRPFVSRQDTVLSEEGQGLAAQMIARTLLQE